MILSEIKNIYIKNRLTEGVDFVRKEWLKGDGVAYINFPDTVAFSIKIKEFDTNVTNYARGYKLDTDRLLRLYVGEGGSTTNCSGLVIDKADGRITTNYRSPLSDIGLGEHIITKTAETDKIGVFTDGVRHKKNSSTDIDYIGTDLIFNQLIPNSNLYICYLTSTSLNLTPCQLLKSIPATLDANNIARQAGECGMYDSISGKFYGNVANSGTFTVEGDVEPETHSGLQQIYQNKLIEGVDYETYDWLKGDNTARIEWTANLWNNQLHTIVGKEKKTFILSERAFSVIYKSDSDYLMVIFRSEDTGHIADISPFSSMSDVVDFKFYINNNVGYCKRNNVLFTGGTMTTEWNDDVKFYIYGGKMKLLEEYDSVNDKLISSLVPCQLLHAIPRNLDAQCKERVAGECGMIDLISGKFYGNVASSGTFTVENDTENNE